MKIQKNHVVALSYELTVNGNIVDSATEGQAKNFISRVLNERGLAANVEIVHLMKIILKKMF